MRALRRDRRGDRAGRAVPPVCASRHAQGVTRRASRGPRHHAAPRGVRDTQPAPGDRNVAGHSPDSGSGRRPDLVSPDLPDREEDRARMAQVSSHVTRCTSQVTRHTSHVARHTSHVTRCTSLAVAAVLAFAGPLTGQTSLSIYSDGRVVARRTLPQPLTSGRNAVTLKVGGLGPATLFSPDTSVALVSAVLRPPTDRAAALEQAVGQT